MTEQEKHLLEVRLAIAELELETLRKRRNENGKPTSRDNSLLIAIIGAVSAAVLAIINNASQFWTTYHAEQTKLASEQKAERTKLESSLILKAMEPGNAADRKKFLVFLLDAGLLTDPEGKIRQIPEESLPRAQPPSSSQAFPPKSKYLRLVPAPQTGNLNHSPAKQATLMAFFGAPGASGTNCGPVTNERLKSLITTRDFGLFKATGLTPALDALGRALDRVKSEKPDLYVELGTLGMLCVRNVRGSNQVFSPHSWGTAIDISIAGEDDLVGDGLCFEGLALLAPYLNDEGFCWGAGFGREEGMHFEISEEQLQAWHSLGIF